MQPAYEIPASPAEQSSLPGIAMLAQQTHWPIRRLQERRVADEGKRVQLVCHYGDRSGLLSDGEVMRRIRAEIADASVHDSSKIAGIIDVLRLSANWSEAV
jgi:hypothetical protein